VANKKPKPRSKRFEKKKELTEEELEAERGGPLPDREALSVLDANIPIPADPTIAADVLSGEDPPDPDDGSP
jgi:hypothetical protein